MDGFSQACEDTARELQRRILTLIPDHREILTLEGAWDLFRIPGFRCDDLNPSLAQAQAALSAARVEWYRRKRG